MGLDPKFWGPHIWYTIHSIAMNYPDKPTNTDKTNMFSFIISLSYVLPCEGCLSHFKEVITFGYKNKGNGENISPLTEDILSSRATFFKWTYDIHAWVSKHKPGGSDSVGIPTYEEIVMFYNSKILKGKKLLYN